MDPRVTRRSARLAEAQRPSYPQTQPVPLPPSANTSAFHSSSSLSSISSLHTTVSASTSPMQSQEGQFPQRFAAGPMPSPSQSNQAQYFAPFHQAQDQLPQQQQMQMQMQMQSPQQSSSYMGQRGGQEGAPETAPYLNNLNLVAEAAKRAQMACLMRDFGECEL